MSRYDTFCKFARTAYLSIALLLAQAIIVAIHAGLHATLEHDHCEIAQLLHVSPSSVPTSIQFILPPAMPILVDVLEPAIISRIHVRHFLIRAPPVLVA